MQIIALVVSMVTVPLDMQIDALTLCNMEKYQHNNYIVGSDPDSVHFQWK